MGVSPPRQDEPTSAWQAAREFGIDTTLLESSLARTPAERLRELVAMNHLHARMQARTLSPEARARLEAAELRDKFGALLERAS